MTDTDLSIPSRVRVKICGITRPQDALAAANAGTDAIGLIFYEKSPRYVTIDSARLIVKTIPPFVTIVGLFVDAMKDEINTVLDNIPLDILQFHGDESDEQCQQYSRPYIKAVRMREQIKLDDVADQYSGASALLLDTYVKDARGGTGIVFDWLMIPPERNKPIILAGGLTPENVREAITQVKPYGVDVSGGVETGKGIKDAGKIAAFMKEVTDAQNE
jgi:phosphoribosylanthranilate isomerase